MPKRTWIELGTTAVDLDTVVKIDFDNSDARLFVVAGEALLMTAWTKDRAEIGRLKEYAALGNGWASVRAEAEQDDDGDAPSGRASDERCRLSAVDKAVFVETANGPAAELFAGGVFIGQTLGEENIDMVRRELGL